MIIEEQLQHEVIRLLNKWAEGYEIELLEMFARWTNEHLISPYRIVKKPENYGKKDMWVLEKKDDKNRLGRNVETC